MAYIAYIYIGYNKLQILEGTAEKDSQIFPGSSDAADFKVSQIRQDHRNS